MSVSTTDEWSALLEPGANKIFIRDFKSLPKYRPYLYGTNTSEKNKETQWTTGTLTKFEKFNGSVSSQEITQGYDKDYTHVEFTGSVDIQYKLWKDDQYGVIEGMVKELSEAANYKIEYDATEPFNKAFDTTYVGADGLQLCSNAHTSFVSGVADQDNLYTAPLTTGNYITARKNLKNFKKYNGEKMFMRGDCLHVPLNLEDKAIEICMSKYTPEDANNSINAINSSFKPQIIVNEFLDDDNNWFLMDKRMMKLHNNWFTREKLRTFRDQSQSTLVMKFAGYMRYSFGHTDWKWLIGNQVS